MPVCCQQFRAVGKPILAFADRKALAKQIAKDKPVKEAVVHSKRVYILCRNVDANQLWVSELADCCYLPVLIRQSSPLYCQIMPSACGGGVWAMVDGRLGAPCEVPLA